MAIQKPKPEWRYDPSTYSLSKYGLLELAGRWAVAKIKDPFGTDYEIVSDWLDDKKTVEGFLKLLRGE